MLNHEVQDIGNRVAPITEGAAVTSCDMSRDVGTRLRALRIERGLTQEQLAAPRFSHAYVSSIEAGRRALSRAALAHFAEKLGVDPDELATGRPAGIEEQLRLKLSEARVALSRGQIDDARRTYQESADAARDLDFPTIAAGAVEGLARCLEQEGQLEKAAAEFERAESLLRGQPALAAVNARCGRARCIAQRGDRRYAAHLLEGLLDRLVDTPSPDALAYIHATLIPIYFRMGAWSAAKASADQALRVAPNIDDPYVLATTHVQVARVLLGKGHHKLARESLVLAEDLFRGQELDTEVGMAHLAYGVVATNEGTSKEARIELKKAHEIFKRAGRRVETARAANALARLEREAGELDTAKELLQESISLLSAESDASELAWSHRELGLCLTESEPTLAEKHLNSAIALFKLAEDTVELAVSHWHLGHLQRARGRKTDACETFEAGLRLLHERS